MRLSITSDLDYSFDGPTDVLIQIEAAMIPEQQVEHAHIDLPEFLHFARLPGHDTIGDRIWLRVEGNCHVRYESVVNIIRMQSEIAGLAKVAPHQLPAETIEYMLPSRYCPSDQFQNLVESDFGGLDGGDRIAAMTDWIGEKFHYVPGSSDASTGALQTYVAREGVCRDFAHLLICMTRASGIPARFASVYGLGVDPQDFHAVAEVFLDGAWYPVDATGMSSSERMAKIGVGRDAADVSFLTSYGQAHLNSQTVNVEAA